MYHCSELPATFNSYCHQMKKPRRPCTTAQRCLRPSIDQISKPMRKPRKPNEPMNAYTSPHAPTDTVARIGPDSVKLARNGCMLPSAVRLSLSRCCTHQPHPCTVLTAAHHIHTRQPDAVPARLAYQRPLVNTYCMFDLQSHLRARHTSVPVLLMRPSPHHC